jgi:hypothetical protein
MLGLSIATAVNGQSVVAGGESRGEVSIVVTLQTPADVNQRPLCEELAIHCSGSGKTFPDLGLAMSAGRGLGRGIAAVAEIGFYGNKWSSGPRAEDQHTNHVRSALAGLRFASPFHPYRPSITHDSIRVFLQLLTGGQWSTLDPMRPLIQPGVGADIAMKRVTARLQFDYYRVSGAGRDLSTSRGSFGLVHRLGTSGR